MFKNHLNPGRIICLFMILMMTVTQTAFVFADEETGLQETETVTEEVFPEEGEEDSDLSEETQPVSEEETLEVRLSVLPSQIELIVGESYTFDVEISGLEEAEIVWSTEDSSIIDLDEDGTVTALEEGNASVRAAIKDSEIYADAFIRVVSDDQAQLVFSQKSYEIHIGETISVPYDLSDSAYDEVEWILSDDQAVHISTKDDGNVYVEGLESGVVQLTGKVNGSSDTVSFIILEEDDQAYESIRALGESKASTITGTFSVNYNQNSARDLAQQLNYYRWNTAQISTLVYDYTIEKYAMQRAAEQALSFSHTRPDGSAWHTVFDKSVYGSESTTNLNENILYFADGATRSASEVLEKVLADNTQRTRSLRKSNRSFGIGHVVSNGVDCWVMLFSDWPAANTSQSSAVNGSKDVSVKISSSFYNRKDLVFSPGKSVLTVAVNKSTTLPSVTGKVKVVLFGQQKNISITGYTVKWALDNVAKRYASIRDNKVVAGPLPNNNETAKLIGTVSLNGASEQVSVQLKVVQPVTGVTVSPVDKQIDQGETLQLKATVLPENATDKSVTWKSSNTGIATVSSKGVVTAKKGGSCTITVTTNDGGYKAISSITVIVHAERIGFEISELTLTEGMSDKLVPVFYPKDTTDQAVTFSSSDSSKVKVEADGTLTALKVTGEDPVTITMRAHDNPFLTADLPVTVKDKDQVRKPYASFLFDSRYEIPCFDYEIDGLPDYMIKGDLIILHCDTKDAQIYYTTDGSVPTASSTRYTGMFPYSGGEMTIKVIAVKEPQMKNSEVYVFKIEEEDEPLWEILEEDLEKLKGDDDLYHIPSGLWVAGVDESVAYTGNKVTFANLRVYNRNHILTANEDYKVAYKNNVNVCPEGNKACTIDIREDGSYVPSGGTKVSYITISGSGNYKDKVYVPFEIKPLAICEENGFTYEGELYMPLGSKALKPVPVILWNGKKLKNNSDFVVAYSRNAQGTDILNDGIAEEGDFYAIISGVNNFTVSEDKLAVPIHVKAGATLLSKATMKIADVEYTGETINPDTLDIRVTLGKAVLEKGTDFIIEKITPEQPKEIGTVTVTIKALPGSAYLGEKTGTFKISGKQLSKAKVYCLGNAVTYTGSTFTLKDLYKYDPKRPDLSGVTLFDGDEKLIEGKDYEVQVNGQNKGKGTVTFTGIGSYSGKISKSFTVNAKVLEKEDLLIYLFDMPFTKNGARPDVYVFLKTDADDPEAYELEEGVYGKMLNENTDYSLKYFNNKSIYTDDSFKTKNPPSVSVVLKGNYKGTAAGNYFLITHEDISYMEISAADIVYSSSKKGTQYYVKPVIYDYQGKKLTLNKDYTLSYYYAEDAKVNGSKTYNRAYGTPVRAGDVPEPGTVIAIEASGTGSYFGTLYTEYKVFEKAMNISSAKVSIDYKNGKNKYFEYTGAQIVPGAENLQVTLNKKTLVCGVDYEIRSVTNNIRSGKASLIIAGLGEYGGTKTVSFAIGKQSLFLDLGNLIRRILGI